MSDVATTLSVPRAPAAPIAPARSALFELSMARAREFLREPEAVFWAFAFPVLMALSLGAAFRSSVPDPTPVAVVDSGPAARAAVATLRRSTLIAPTLVPRDQAQLALQTGRVALLVEPGPPPVLSFDRTRNESHLARLEAQALLADPERRAPVIAAQPVAQPGGRYVEFLLPGLIGMLIMGSGVWSVASSVSTARSKQVLKRLMATPMRRRDYLLAQLLGRLFFLPEMVLLIGFGWLVFGIPVRGSLVLTTAVCLLGVFCFGGLGLLVGARARTLEAASALANLVMAPMWLLSGIFFSTERFPAFAQPLIGALPLTALNQALRGIMTEGQPAISVWPQLAILGAWTATGTVLGLRLFRWR
jgi:ABC-2 type transport system permease protein